MALSNMWGSFHRGPKRQMPNAPDRRNRILIKVHCSPEDKQRITALATEVGLPASAYLRSLGLQYRPAPVVDLQHIRTLSGHVGNLGRMGGLLKLWLSDDKKLREIDPETIKAEIRHLVLSIEKNQESIRAVMRQIASKGAAAFPRPGEDR